MPEQVQKILDRIIEWWKKFNNKQRILILSAVAVVIIALGILAVVLATPSVTMLYRCENYTEASQIKELLDTDETINYSTSDDGLIFYVEEEDEATASMLLGSNEISTVNYSIDSVVDGSFTSTEADKQKKYQEFLEKKFASHISNLSIIESCTVDLDMPKDDGTILSREQSATAAVNLVLKSDMSSEQAYALAKYVATQLGNDSTEGVTIIDSDCNVLYSGSDAESSIGIASTQLSYKQKLESYAADKISDILVGSKIFANVEAAINLDVTFDNKEVVKTELGIPQGMDGGAITQQSLYDMVTTQGYEGGVPGTDTNDDTTYVIEDDGYGKTEISESDTVYEYDRTVTTILGNGGNVQYDSSSVTVSANKYIVYDETELRTSGALEEMTWDEFKAANSEARVVEVDDMYISMIANATGVPESKVTFVCYEEPRFIDEEDGGFSVMDYAQIAIAVLIFALLGYVVFRSTRGPKVEELQPEVSVESLLESTVQAQQEQLEDIGYAEKSEVRLMIEKFVDENPDAVANLLRNWLNEEWE
ncbi:MAG: flagellar biosynthesis protein [Agathobacter sp.]|nr:flagellar biosynthesis protein [Agathobacter sp.]